MGVRHLVQTAQLMSDSARVDRTEVILVAALKTTTLTGICPYILTRAGP